MKLYNICYNDKYKLDGAENISISSLDMIPNFSAPSIYISFLNAMSMDQSIQVIGQLCLKLKVNGILTFRLIDWDQLISYYQNGDLDTNSICSHMFGTQCLINRGDIIKMFHKSNEINIDNITYDNVFCTYTLSRKAL